jgi:hypothetical protein
VTGPVDGESPAVGRPAVAQPAQLDRAPVAAASIDVGEVGPEPGGTILALDRRSSGSGAQLLPEPIQDDLEARYAVTRCSRTGQLVALAGETDHLGLPAK